MAWVTHSSGLAIPEPAYGSGTITLSSMVDAGRNANGKYVGTYIGTKQKVEMSWEVLTPDQYSAMLDVFHGKNGFINTFTVFDPRTQTYVEKRMYVGDRSATPIMVDSSGIPKYWTGAKIDIIEV